MEPWIETYTGKKFWFTSDDPSEVSIEDIGWALSHMCRFTGHCNRFYSVAEHCLHVSRLAGLEGLLHDASEAYLADIASPIKQLLPEYKIWEGKIMKKVALAFGLQEGFESSPGVKLADWALLRAEADILLPSKGKDWYFPNNVLHYEFTDPVIGLMPEFAYYKFMERYKELTNELAIAA